MSFVGKWFGFGRNPHYDAGIRAYERRDFTEAVEQFKICLASDPDPAIREPARNYLAGALGRLARADRAKGEVSEAIRRLREATTIRPHFADLQYALAECLVETDDLDGASAALKLALERNSEYAEAVALQVLIAIRRNDWEGACSRAGWLPEHRIDWPRRAQLAAALDTGDMQAALEALNDLVQTPEKTANELADKGDEFMKAQAWDVAAEHYRQALDQAPRFADIRCKYGEALLNQKMADAASAEFREAIAINPRYAEAHALLGVALRATGDEEGARAAFHAALEIDPHHSIATTELTRPRLG